MQRSVGVVAGIILVFSSAWSMSEVCVSYITASVCLYNHNSTALATHSLFLAFWSSDNSTSGFNPAAPDVPTGGDVLLGAYDISTGPAIAGRITGGALSAVTYGTGTSQYSPGYLYIATFEFPYSSYTGPGSIPAGTYYGLGPTMSLTQQYPTPSTPDDYGSGIVASPITTSSQTVVPEPSTLGLLGVGLVTAGACAVRRKRA